MSYIPLPFSIIRFTQLHLGAVTVGSGDHLSACVNKQHVPRTLTSTMGPRAFCQVVTFPLCHFFPDITPREEGPPFPQSTPHSVVSQTLHLRLCLRLTVTI